MDEGTASDAFDAAAEFAHTIIYLFLDDMHVDAWIGIFGCCNCCFCYEFYRDVLRWFRWDGHAVESFAKWNFRKSFWVTFKEGMGFGSGQWKAD